MEESLSESLQKQSGYRSKTITLMLCPDSILLPMSNRTKEMRKIMAHNSVFFSNILSNLSKDIRENLEALWTTVDRDCMDDLQWLRNVKQILSKLAEDEYFWKKWCYIVGCDENNFRDYYLKTLQNNNNNNTLISKENISSTSLHSVKTKFVDEIILERE
ncbi:hypothetical protein PNEG_00559 [Pneumocystis murina B123]|uniref:Uncharacterized protein n=1 Tax=Pneumocystis murina (strain B123) TaxID=1069680 RepID=M7NWM0_PNEMU|nr:hypothetical protein PNEG_00559 [Pneumocystis murina B123]EMR11551.1 hypothetical protein PNEG_00559 [Pneumocystis murina B123]